MTELQGIGESEILFESSEEDQDPVLEYEIMNYPADITLGGYVEYNDKNELIIPDFQRNYVWDKNKASKLIESFLIGLPVPGVFLYKKKSKKGFLIIDGQQRILSIIKYIKGTFNDSVFKLKSVNPRYEGKSFLELDEDDQFKLRGAVLRATIIQQINPLDDTSIYQIFERLNTGGVNLNPMEVRQCLSFGPLVKILKELNEDLSWREILGQKKVDKRLRDVELILRCMALSEYGELYEKPMKGFLNKYMEKEKKEVNYEDMKNNFYSSVSYIRSSLGEKPFHIRGRLNYGALDSVMAMVLLGIRPSDLQPRFNNMLQDEEYMSSITVNTSDESEVAKRLLKARNYMG